MEYSETYQVIIFVTFIVFIAYYIFTYMDSKKTTPTIEGFDINPSLPGGTTNASSYSDAIKQLRENVYNQLYVTNNDSLNKQYIQVYNSNLANFKTMVNTVQAQIPLSINFDADQNTISENVVEQMKLLNTLSTGRKNLDTIVYTS
jgi:hypothetical protein